MTLGALDLSIVTDHIVTQLGLTKPNSRLWDEIDEFEIKFSGLPPDHAGKSDVCQVSLYLFHVSPNPAHHNTYPDGGQARITPYHPLALTLYYLLSAHAGAAAYRQAQQAMSVVLKWLHEHPVMTAAVPGPADDERFTVTMEPQSVDEIGRLWLALATPLRLSAVYRAEVVFLAPEEPAVSSPNIVLRPDVEPVPDEVLASSSLTSSPTSTGTAVVTGAGFDAAKIGLRIGGLTFRVVAGAPAPGEARVVSGTELHVSLPSGTLRGRYRLYVSLLPGGPAPDSVVLDLEKDVP